MLTQSQYEEITRYKEMIENCSSLNEYCKCGSDKAHWHQFVLMDYSKLERYVERD